MKPSKSHHRLKTTQPPSPDDVTRRAFTPPISETRLPSVHSKAVAAADRRIPGAQHYRDSLRYANKGDTAPVRITTDVEANAKRLMELDTTVASTRMSQT